MHDLPNSDLPPVARLLHDAVPESYDSVVLDYDARMLRRKRLQTQHGQGFMVDLPAVTNLDEYWGFELEDGRVIRIVAAGEAVLRVTGDLARLAWHIGNRHTPCEIHEDHLLIREDHVLERMLEGLGATITRVTQPFAPESGAYGTGRTMGHDHGHSHAGHGHHHGDSEHGDHTHGDNKHGHHHAHDRVSDVVHHHGVHSTLDGDDQ
ncbi:urease accessory protein UreE [Rhodobacter sp. NTK016B]|uniref:urease accessory protein UreE n=1 Tax=Rhodobacter sp. NTK016B TaxID=2759676 RepID=UPI001A8E962B|nr:urease accessory protein UreE [Rhodobacter sp. NTK016B]MBN8291767.1 urease accessory protein UreE [Rhodobacter sp. NTK016B]